MKTAAARFAAHALGTRFADLPAAVVERAKVFVLDSLGVGIAGSSVEGGEGLVRVASGWGGARGWSRYRCGVVSVRLVRARRGLPQRLADAQPGIRLPARGRGGACHGHRPAGRAGCGRTARRRERRRADRGRRRRRRYRRRSRPRLARGLSLLPSRHRRRLRRGGGGGRLLGLDRPTLEAAFAWQLAQVSGTMQAHTEGSPILPVQLAFNARAALQSCELATLGFERGASGVRGALRISGAVRGRLRTRAGARQPRPRSGGWPNSATSRFPRAAPPMAASKACMALRAEHGFAAADVARVEVIAPPLIVRLVGRPPRPDAGASYARLCMAYAVAKTLQQGALDLAHFRGDALADPGDLRAGGARRDARRRQHRSQCAGAADRGGASEATAARCRGAARRCSPIRRAR